MIAWTLLNQCFWHTRQRSFRREKCQLIHRPPSTRSTFQLDARRWYASRHHSRTCSSYHALGRGSLALKSPVFVDCDLAGLVSVCVCGTWISAKSCRASADWLCWTIMPSHGEHRAVFRKLTSGYFALATPMFSLGLIAVCL